MRSSLRPSLVNGRFGDPAVFVELAHERDAVLFDMGDLSALSARDLLRVCAVGVSHMHMDHLIGFDKLLRVNVGRAAEIELVGPAGLAACIGNKLGGYSWDLADRYDTDLLFKVRELAEPGVVRETRFRFSSGFAGEPLATRAITDDIVLESPQWRLRAAILQHHGPCLGFALEEPCHLNIWRNRVDEAGLPVGAWLKDLKAAVRDGRPGDTLIQLPSGAAAPLADLRSLVSIDRGQKIGYVTDVADIPSNREAIAALCREADLLFIEASFAVEDAVRAASRAHLTTKAAGEIARASLARRVEPFHFSPRYGEQEERLLAQVAQAFTG